MKRTRSPSVAVAAYLHAVQPRRNQYSQGNPDDYQPTAALGPQQEGNHPVSGSKILSSHALILPNSNRRYLAKYWM